MSPSVMDTTVAVSELSFVHAVVPSTSAAVMPMVISNLLPVNLILNALATSITQQSLEPLAARRRSSLRCQRSWFDHVMRDHFVELYAASLQLPIVQAQRSGGAMFNIEAPAHIATTHRGASMRALVQSQVVRLASV